MERLPFATLLGKTIRRVELDDEQEEMTFICDEETFILRHEQDCCESVWIDDICGEVVDLLNAPILQADEEYSDNSENADESSTWSFYKLGTINSRVTIRFCGISNGYYSETASLYKE